MKNRLLVLFLYRTFLVTFLISCLNFEIAYCQIQYNESELWSKESFSSFQISDEDISLRTEYSKHFRNSNGKITAVISAGPIHYMEDGKWKTIYHSIIPNGNGFENTFNRFKTYYPGKANGSLTTILEDGNTIQEMQNMKMYFLKDNLPISIQSISNSSGQVDFNKLTYKHVYGNGIDLRLEHNTINRKLDYIINTKDALPKIPIGSSHLVFEETIQLPSKWKAIRVNNEIQTLNCRLISNVIIDRII